MCPKGRFTRIQVSGPKVAQALGSDNSRFWEFHKIIYIKMQTILTLKANLYGIYEWFFSTIERTAKAILRPRKPKSERKNSWIRLNEFKRYCIVTAWITNTRHLRAYYILLLERIEKLWRVSGSTWAFAYMKEVLRLTIRALAGSPEIIYHSGIRVKRDLYGLPTIIPLPLRDMFREIIKRDGLFEYATQRRSIIATLTIISVFRQFPTKVKPSLDTITAPFSGVSQTLDQGRIQNAIDSIMDNAGKRRKIIIGNFMPHVTSKAGPNGPFSTWGASMDAIAFIHEPRQLYLLVRWMLIQKAYWWIVLFVFLILVYGPLYYIMYLTGVCRKLYLGKLSVVLDQAGKARVVAITNWWLQSAFAGLHNSIFKLLNEIPQDGTFDQDACFNKFLNRADPFTDLSGFDLSAATDRLPLELQVQILNALGVDGNIWGSLLRNISWYFPNKEGLPSQVSYNVGQPMGALSSWAMLALTHHVIVRYAALLGGRKKPQFVNYAVLGDDCVINNSTVAPQYLAVMSELGLSISMGKSVISKRFTEFAKKLKGPSYDITPFGSGLILSAVRSSYFIPTLLVQAIRMFQLSAEEVLVLVKTIPSGILDRVRTRALAQLSVWHSFINNDWVREVSLLDVRTLSRYSNFFSADIALFPEALVDTMYVLCLREIESKLESAHEALQNFLMEAFTTFSSRTVPLRILEFLMKPINPGFWVYLIDGFRVVTRCEDALKELDGYRAHKAVPLDAIRYIRNLDPRINGLDLKNLVTRKEASLIARYYFRVYDGMRSRIFM